ncbi:MAG: TonB-dependent receptor domain-containing protein [Gemmatimonadota bacterium]
MCGLAHLGRRCIQQPRRSSARTLAVLLFPLLSVAFASSALEAQSQATTGIIRGVVRDPAGNAVATAGVTVHHRETGLERTLTTSGSGVFVATLLPVGTYDVTVRALGQFGEIREEGVVLRVGETVQLALEFQPVALAELKVSGQAALVDETDVTSSQRLSSEVVDGLPNNGRNYLDYTQLTPGVSIVQGPDGDELTISGQRGIFNNVTVDGADFNNPFFGEQRGGQRPAFTFNQDAVQELVVVSQGATAEFGRSAGGFVNVITKSGTNEFKNSVHYFGQFDGISADFPSSRGGGKPDFTRNQFGGTFGGPIVKDKAFFFLAYDQQEMTETKQFTRNVVNPAELQKLQNFLQSRWPGLFDNEFGPVSRTDDNKAFIAKFDWNINSRHKASVKYNYTWSQQVNGTFDVDSWGASSNGIEKDFSHAVNGSLSSQVSNTVSNELRFQWAREDRPRGYRGPLIPGATPPGQPQFGKIGGRPFPDTGMDFADGFRIGLPFFLPIDPGFDRRFQLLDNVSIVAGNHLFKVGGEWNRTDIGQQFIGFANSRYIFDSVDGFINFVEQGPNFVTCSDGSSNTTGSCPPGTTITGPLLLFLQAATVPPTPTDQLGSQSFDVNELAFFIQDTWKPAENLTINAGLRWEGTWHPDQFIRPEDTFYAPFLGQTKLGQAFPSDGTIPNDLNNWQPRFGLAWDVNNDGRTKVRLNAGSYFSRIPMLVFAQHRTTNGAFQQIIFHNSATTPFLGPAPAYGELGDTEGALPFLPDIQVASRDLELPRTWSFSGGIEQHFGEFLAGSISYQHARTDNLFRFVDRTDPVFGSPWTTGLPFVRGAPSSPADTVNGIGRLIVTESTARSRYNAITFGLKGRGAFDNRIQFEANYTLGWDKSDDDNERDPFTFKYARADRLDREYNWSDRDQRSRFNGYFMFRLPEDVFFNNIIRFASAQPTSESCGPTSGNPFAPPAGQRAVTPQDRICADGTILKRNTLRKDNELFRWDVRVSRAFAFGRGSIEPILEVFNLTNADNFLDTSVGGLLFNFDGTIRSGLGDTRRAQLGAKIRF